MGISLVPTHPPKWYARSNTATAILSASIAIYYGVYEFVLTSSVDNSGIDFQLAILALIHALYGLTLFNVLKIHHPRTAGFVSFLLFFVVSAYAFWITKDTVNTYFAILVIAGMISGLYGWLLSILINASVMTMLFMIQTGEISANENYSGLQLVIYASVSLMTILIWSSAGQVGDGGIAEPEPKKSKGFSFGRSKSASKLVKGDLAASLSTDILLSSITDGVAIVNSRGEIETFNPSAQEMTGWSDSEANKIDHRSVLILTDQQDKIYSDQMNPISQSLATGKPQIDHNAKIQTRSKKSVEIDILASPIMDGANTTASVVIFRDVSKQRSEERQRAEFISTASHEMRTPVAAIEGYLALAMNEKVSKIDSSARGYLDKAHASTQHLGKLFQDLLTAAKSEDGRLTNNPQVVEMGQLLDELIEGARFTAEKKGLLMNADFGQSSGGEVNAQSGANLSAVRPLVYVFVDPERIREVITNLFDNAVKYTDEGKVTIGMHTENQQVIVNVSDTGPGIPKEDIPHLFQKFYRVDNSATRQVGGTGLGLFICRKIVELYSGRIWAESTLGEGSSFKIALPRLSNDRAQELMRMEAQKQSPAGVSAPTGSPGAVTSPDTIAQTASPASVAPAPVVHTVDATQQAAAPPPAQPAPAAQPATQSQPPQEVKQG